MQAHRHVGTTFSTWYALDSDAAAAEGPFVRMRDTIYRPGQPNGHEDFENEQNRYSKQFKKK